MAKLIIRKQAVRQPTDDDMSQALEMVQGGCTARALAGRTGMPIKTAMRALHAVQARDPSVRSEFIPLRDNFAIQQLLYKRLG